MGSGKTTLGKKLASRLNIPFIDSDEAITKIAGRSIPEIFSEDGEVSFRELEKQFLESLDEKETQVISTGGGMPCFNENMDRINNKGLSVYIRLSPPALSDRLINSKTERPLIKGKTKEELKLFIEEKLAERESFYNKAHITFDGVNLSKEKIEELANLINAYKR